MAGYVDRMSEQGVAVYQRERDRRLQWSDLGEARVPDGWEPARRERTGLLPAAPVGRDRPATAVGRRRPALNPGHRLCAAIVDRLTFNGTIIETGTDPYRLAGRQQISRVGLLLGRNVAADRSVGQRVSLNAPSPDREGAVWCR
jgi:hypothetical protein